VRLVSGLGKEDWLINKYVFCNTIGRLFLCQLLTFGIVNIIEFKGNGMEAFQKDIVKLIDVCRIDEHFLSIVSPMYEWRDWVTRAGASNQSLKLMDRLSEYYPDVFDQNWGTPNNHKVISPFDVARWLCQKANDVGSKSAFQLFLDFIKKTTIPLYVISLVEGVIPHETYYFDQDTYFCKFHGLPVGVHKRMNIHWANDCKNFPGEEPAYIVTKVYCDVLGLNGNRDFNRNAGKELFDIGQAHFLKSSFISLFTKEYGACIKKQWYIFEDTMPCSGFVDGSETLFLQVISPFYSEKLRLVEKDCFKSVFKKFNELPKASHDSIELALKRKTSAMNAIDIVDVAIDMGMCAESILTKSKSSEQLSLQVRLLGAKLSSSIYDERVSNYNYLKAFYNVRSSAVHNAKVDELYRVKGVGKVPPKEVLKKASEILSCCILTVIDIGGMDDLEKELILLQ